MSDRLDIFLSVMFSRHIAGTLIDLCRCALNKKMVFTYCKYSQMLHPVKNAEVLSTSFHSSGSLMGRPPLTSTMEAYTVQLPLLAFWHLRWNFGSLSLLIFTQKGIFTSPSLQPGCSISMQSARTLADRSVKTNKSSDSKTVSLNQANRHNALISSAIRPPWCKRKHFDQKEPLPTLAQKCVCSFPVGDSWQLLLFKPLK